MKDVLFSRDTESTRLSLDDAGRILRNVFIACEKEPVSLYDTIKRMQDKYELIDKEASDSSERTPVL